jgi:Bacterial regulatory protein, arsR family
MSKQGDTKEKILKLISEGSDNLSDISRKLDLAPSTVSKHIHDLERSKAIEQKSNVHVKKWKYYKVSSGANEFGGSRFVGERNWNGGMAAKRNIFATAAVACVMLALFAFLQAYAPHTSSGTAYVPISITDPPIVPSGTQALYINYSSIGVRTNYDGKSEWISVNSIGRLDLISLINESQVIGGANIISNSTIDQVEFNIVSASITVDNVTYPVTITKKQIVAAIMNNKKVNDTSGVLLDFSPVVTPVYSNNATTFVLNPSLMAAIVPGMGFGGPKQQGPGQQYPLQQKYVNLFTGNNMTITNTSLVSDGNDTSLDITLKNDGNSNVTVMGVTLMGDVMPYFASNAQPVNGFVPNALPGNAMEFNCSRVMNLPMTYDQGMLPGNAIIFNGLVANWSAGKVPLSNSMGFNESMDNWIGQHDNPGAGLINSSVTINASAAPMQNGFPFGMPIPNANVFNQENSSVTINMSAVLAIGKACGVDEIGIRLPAPTNDIEMSGIEKASAGAADFQDGLSMRFAFMHPVGVGFSVGDNAALSMQFPGEGNNQTAPETRYVLAPGATVTLGYDGKLEIGHGTPDASLNDSSYVITVMTSKGIAQANVTSS